MDPQPVDGSEFAAWKADSNSEATTVEALNRFLRATVEDSWQDLDRALRLGGPPPALSRILPLGDQELIPYLNGPGIFFIFGPPPAVPLLHVGASRGPVGFVLRSRIEKRPRGRFKWRWERRSDSPPTFVAVAALEDHWAFAPRLRDLIDERLGGETSGSDEAARALPLV